MSETKRKDGDNCRLTLEFGYGIIPLADVNQGGDLLDRVVMIRRQIALELGAVVPIIRLRDNIQLNPNQYIIKIKGIQVTEGEILDAIHRPLGATTLDGVKRRTRAGMGRCQAGFCSPKTVEILARELSVDMEKITKAGAGSEFLTGFNKGCGGNGQNPGMEKV